MLKKLQVNLRVSLMINQMLLQKNQFYPQNHLQLVLELPNHKRMNLKIQAFELQQILIVLLLDFPKKKLKLHLKMHFQVYRFRPDYQLGFQRYLKKMGLKMHFSVFLAMTNETEKEMESESQAEVSQNLQGRVYRIRNQEKISLTNF